MNDFVIARCQMGMSMFFHIVFAAIGIALPLMMCLSEWLWHKTGHKEYEELAKRWAKGTAILFAVGAVSGTVLSFELGLLWPGFMRFAGEIIGLAFALEGIAFFTEAIFLGIYLYGWDKVPRKAHLFAGIMVAISGAMSALFVCLANGWMNTPAGFRLENGKPTDIDPVTAMLNQAGIPEAIHMLIAAYAATAFCVAGIHAALLLKNKKNLFHRRALALALCVGGAMALIQPISGDVMAQLTARVQPVKLAAMEAHYETKAGAPIDIGGVIKIPKMLSFLAFHDHNAVVKGLNDFPKEDWPNVNLVHICFQVMVACGVLLMLLSGWAAFSYFKTRELPDSNSFLKAVTLASPLGFIAIETGWMVTEIGRQPWIVQNVLRTSSSVTPMPGLAYTFVLFTLLYIFLALIVVFLVFRQIAKSPLIVEIEPVADKQS